MDALLTLTLGRRVRVTLLFAMTILGIALVAAPAQAQPVAGGDVLDCGGRGERPCNAHHSTAEWAFVFGNGNFGCDRGLKEVNNVCLNDTRRQNVGIAFRQTALGRALAMQQRLTWDTPLGYLSDITVHNSYENHADGYPAGSQTYSITELLDAGFRQFELDVWTDSVNMAYPKLCHGACSAADRYFASALKELRDWLKEPGHETDVVTVMIENHIDPQYISLIDTAIEQLLANDPAIGVYSGLSPWDPDSAATSTTPRPSDWPTRRQLVDAGTRVLFTINGTSVGKYLKREPYGSLPLPNAQNEAQVQGYPTCTIGVLQPDGKTYKQYSIGAYSGFVRDSYPADEQPTAEVLSRLSSCGLDSMKVNHLLRSGIDPERLESAMWSWAPGEPSQTAAATAVQLHTEFARPWVARDPTDAARYLCRHGSPHGVQFWTAGPAGPWSGGFAACQSVGPGWTYGAPRTSFETQAVLTLMRDTSHTTLWIPVQTDGTVEGWAERRSAHASMTITSMAGLEAVVEHVPTTLAINADFVVTSVDWDFGDGERDTRNGSNALPFGPVHSWTSAGIYTVTATVRSNGTVMAVLTETVPVIQPSDLSIGPRITYEGGIPNSLKEGQSYSAQFSAAWPLTGIQCAAGTPVTLPYDSHSSTVVGEVVYTASFACVAAGGSAPAATMTVFASITPPETGEPVTLSKRFTVAIADDGHAPALTMPAEVNANVDRSVSTMISVADVFAEPITVTVEWSSTEVQTLHTTPGPLLLQHLFPAPGAYEIYVTASDSAKSSPRTPLTVHVPAIPPSLISIEGPSTPTLMDAATYRFTVRAEDGGAVTPTAASCGSGTRVAGPSQIATHADGSRQFGVKCRFEVEGPTTVSMTFQDSSGLAPAIGTFNVTVIGPMPPRLLAATTNATGPIHVGDQWKYYFTVTPAVSGGVTITGRSCGASGVVRHEPVQTLADHLENIFEFALLCEFTAPGPSVVSMTFRGGSGDEATYAQTVLVLPTAPVLTAPDITVAATGPHTPVSYEVQVQGAPGVACTPADGALFPVGATIVSCTAVNDGGTTTKTFTVTVVDSVAPVVTLTAASPMEATHPWGAPLAYAVSAEDNLDGPLMPVCDVVNGGAIAVGASVTVTCSATDSSNNTGTATVTVTVRDSIAPVIEPVVDLVLSASAAMTVVTYAVPVSRDAVDGVRAATCSPLWGTAFAVGTTMVTCGAVDAAGNQASPVTFTVTVADHVAPIVTIAAPATVEAVGPKGAPLSYTVSATDAVDGAVVASCDAAIGTAIAVGASLTVTCWATDAHGNSGVATATVTVRDTTPPSIAAMANVVVTAVGNTGAIVTYAAPVAVDLVDGASASTCHPASGTRFDIGTHTVTCMATDGAGNIAAPVSFTVTVTPSARDRRPPRLTLPAGGRHEATSSNGAVVTYVASALDAADGAVPVTCAPTSGTAFPLGRTTVHCSARDQAGNVATGTFRVTVVDTTAPEILSVTPSVTVLPANGQMAPVTMAVSVSDLVEPSPVCAITRVTSNIKDAGRDGERDWRITGPLSVSLEAATRTRRDRTYAITVRCTDASGNASRERTSVVVSRHQ